MEKKLDLFNVLDKSMPAVLLSSIAILGSIIYLSSVATIPDTTIELPKTGEEIPITEDFVFIYPELYSTISPPDQVSGLYVGSETIIQVEIFTQKSGESPVSLGLAKTGTEKGEYIATWESAETGTYYLWAEVTYEDLSLASASPIVILVE